MVYTYTGMCIIVLVAHTCIFLGMKAGGAMDFTVKETPLKKQVDHYRRFKLQRLRCNVQCNIKMSVLITPLQIADQRI